VSSAEGARRGERGARRPAVQVGARHPARLQVAQATARASEASAGAASAAPGAAAPCPAPAPSRPFRNRPRRASPAWACTPRWEARRARRRGAPRPSPARAPGRPGVAGMEDALYPHFLRRIAREHLGEPAEDLRQPLRRARPQGRSHHAVGHMDEAVAESSTTPYPVARDPGRCPGRGSRGRHPRCAPSPRRRCRSSRRRSARRRCPRASRRGEGSARPACLHLHAGLWEHGELEDSTGRPAFSNPSRTA